MNEHEDIRLRLEAVEGVDWSGVERAHGAEYYSDWIHVGPVQIMTTFDPGPGGTDDAINAARAEAVADFVQHAADDQRGDCSPRGTPS